jgi:geranylgeranyl diphosphate synthase type II
VTAGDFDVYLETVRARVDAALDSYLPVPPECPSIVSEAVRYSVFAGGKRLRPLLTLAAADATTRRLARRGGASSSPDHALPAACAIELLHTYSLIHDDLPAMDNDELRRGRPTLHVVYGDGIAILAGDALQAEAFSLLAREPASVDGDVLSRKLHVLQLIARAAGSAGMVGGQAIDLQAAGQVAGHSLLLDRASLREMHERKTGALIRAAAVSGAIMAGADEQAAAQVDEYARELGLAFQIVDDVLDVEGDAATLGKTAGKDAASEKPTYPALYGLERSKQLAAECLTRSLTILERADMSDGWLPAIANWVVRRSN